MGRIFGYYKLECNDLDTIRETLTKEQGFDLICALVDYSRDGTITELPAELRIPFAMLKKKVDQAHKVYEDKCNTLKENGRKGGEAKAKNRGQATGSAPAHAKKFKPPTLSQFKNAVKKLVDTDELPCDERIPEYSIEEFYDHLAERNWTINGTPIQSRHDWEMALIAKFYKHGSTIDHLYYWAFCCVFSTYDGLRAADGETAAESVASSYIDDFDEDDKCWSIAGKIYPFSERQAALDAYVADWKDEQEENRPP